MLVPSRGWGGGAAWTSTDDDDEKEEEHGRGGRSDRWQWRWGMRRGMGRGTQEGVGDIVGVRLRSIEGVHGCVSAKKHVDAPGTQQAGRIYLMEQG